MGCRRRGDASSDLALLRALGQPVLQDHLVKVNQLSLGRLLAQDVYECVEEHFHPVIKQV